MLRLRKTPRRRKFILKLQNDGKQYLEMKK